MRFRPLARPTGRCPPGRSTAFANSSYEPRLTVGNAEQLVPDALLKARARIDEWNPECPQCASKVIA